MNQIAPAKAFTACPHDCPSTCALEVEVLGPSRIGRVRGAEENSYTAGVICAKVARYAERVHHPDRLLQPLQRVGAKGEGAWRPVTWDDALDLVAERFVQAEARHGSEAVWPYYYAGTMGLVQRDGIHRLRHAKRYSNQFDSICTNLAWTGFVAGTGKLAGVDPREMAVSDCVVIWGTNAVATQVNVMTHAVRARKERGAPIVVIDIYDNPTMHQADMALKLRPGTDGALACALMHVAFRDNTADRAYLARFADDAAGLEAHLASRDPAWAASITGLTVGEIEGLAALLGRTPRSYFRLGYGFSRQRNGAVAMHAALSVPTVFGHWQYEGGGAFHSNSGIWGFDKSLIEGHSFRDPAIRHLDQSRIGAVLTGDREALAGGPPVSAMLVQNTNPANVAPEQRLVRQGLMRDDLFVCVHEQFMTDTAKLADLVLPAATSMEYDDIYRGGGQSHVLFGPKVIDHPETVRTNHFVVEELAKRLGVADRPGFGLSERELIDDMLKRSGYRLLEALERERWEDRQPPFAEAHYLDGFGTRDGRFRFQADWIGMAAPNRPPLSMGLLGPVADLSSFPDHAALIEDADETHPFRLATPPARQFLNSSFAETKGSRQREGRPELRIHPEDAARLGLAADQRVRVGNARGDVVLPLRIDDGMKPGVLVHEGLWPNDAFENGEGINVLTGADPTAPFGGAAFHDNRVWLRPV
ncbi:molybdopterin-containing oxidoreductase family protein [Aureimonas jatrophae]|uniref:Anaerobic selenocysteine-containing dehydrogenase n=1 Tax=Aureimonas jatrophae TaxID=1166073 RepID=A0A1H0GBH3_9HYPH|nr:molybdopterin oxidoreductase family protein [Aureimonas jatrophae]MBB3949496.1 anaerobic selenocysteine-containing dehydrogenase [Aureimonas jatrophae]SDO04178.1 Anaerobic selenocysteine-containing dehydrogenase [Aureimonas jatrophae]